MWPTSRRKCVAAPARRIADKRESIPRPPFEFLLRLNARTEIYPPPPAAAAYFNDAPRAHSLHLQSCPHTAHAVGGVVADASAGLVRVREWRLQRHHRQALAPAATRHRSGDRDARAETHAPMPASRPWIAARADGWRRAAIGSALRRALRARDIESRIAALNTAIANADTLVARLAHRLRRGLSRRAPVAACAGATLAFADAFALPFATDTS